MHQGLLAPDHIDLKIILACGLPQVAPKSMQAAFGCPQSRASGFSEMSALASHWELPLLGAAAIGCRCHWMLPLNELSRRIFSHSCTSLNIDP
jgi:hypothetical protein